MPRHRPIVIATSSPTRKGGPLRLPRLKRLLPSLEFFRERLAGVEALPQLTILAIAVGGFTGAVILLFRGALEGAARLVGRVDAEDFEGLGTASHLLMPLIGAIALGILVNHWPAESRRVGVVHVMERLSRYQGRMPWRSALYQFWGGIVGLTAGLSGGREGPAVHLGAASAGLLGEWFRLPNNSMRTLVACGAAAAIAASFNTPMAGVIFAMEVVMMEYAIANFLPVIISAVTATVINRWYFGDVVAFAVPETELRSLLEVPYIMLAGVAVGLVGGGFIVLVKTIAGWQRGPFWLRAALAGAVTGIAALFVPAALGVGYDTVNAALLGDLVWTALLAVLIAKTIASAACVGVGLPVGMIGPTLVMGAALGGLLGHLGNLVAPQSASEPALYVMLGMAAMMAAVLQAPLAALVAVLELTANPGVILPAMLIIAVATLTVSQLARQRSVFLTTLATLGLQYPLDPATLHLLRAGVAGLMTRTIARLPRLAAKERFLTGLRDAPSWIAIDDGGDVRAVLSAANLSAHLQGLSDEADAPAVDLMAVPGTRLDVGFIGSRATLLEALAALRSTGLEGLCVTSTGEPGEILGVLTRADIDRYSRAPQAEPHPSAAGGSGPR